MSDKNDLEPNKNMLNNLQWLEKLIGLDKALSLGLVET